MKKLIFKLSSLSFVFVILVFSAKCQINASETMSPYQKLSEFIMQNGKAILLDSKEKMCISEEAEGDFTYYLLTDSENSDVIDCMLIYTGDEESSKGMKAEVRFEQKESTYSADTPYRIDGKSTTIIKIKGTIDTKSYKKGDTVEVESVENGESIGNQFDWTQVSTPYVMIAVSYLDKQLKESNLGLTMADFGFDSYIADEKGVSQTTDEISGTTIDDALQGKWHVSAGSGGDFTFSKGDVVLETGGHTVFGVYDINIADRKIDVTMEASDGNSKTSIPFKYENNKLTLYNSAGEELTKQ